MHHAVAILVAGLGFTACTSNDPSGDESADVDVDSDVDGLDDGGDDDPAGPSEVVLTLSDLLGTTSNATLVAFQDGDGEWTTVTGDAGTYRAMVTSGRYGFAIVCASEGTTTRTTYFGTVAESDTIDTAACTSARLTREVTGTTTGPASLTDILVSSPWGGSRSDRYGTFTWMVPTGPVDLIVSARSSSSTRVIKRAQPAEDQFTIDLSTGVTANVRPLAVSGMVAGEAFFANSTVQTPNGFIGISSGPEPTYLELPASLERPGDRVLFSANSSRMQGANSVSRAATDVMPSLELPAAVPFTPPGADLVVDLPALDEAATVFVSVRAVGITSSMFATPGWLAGASSFAFADPTAATGWQSNWATPVSYTDWIAAASWTDGTASYRSATSGPR